MRWKPGQTEFVVSLSRANQYTRYCRLPAPITKLLGDPDAVEFAVSNGKVTVRAADRGTAVRAKKPRKSA